MTLTLRLRDFSKARAGLAALEFAILLPMMVLLLFGSVDLIDALGANRRAENVAASLADVVARDTEITDDELTGLWAAIGVLMVPDDPDDVKARITSVEIEDATTARIVWSEGRGMSGLTAGGTIDLPDAMMIAGTSVIFAETELHYESPLGILFTGAVALNHEAYRRSRLVDPIPRA